jgi:Ca-activated chloride channel homolog
MSRGKDFYDLLGLPKDATAEEIRSAYFEAALKLHPDTNPEPDAKEAFLKIQEAYEVLSNPQKRTSYDAGQPEITASKPEITTDIKYSRSFLQQLSEPQLLYVLVGLTCTAKPKTSDFSSLNFCLVIDRSTSMEGARMDMVKQNIFHLLRQLKPQDTVSVIAFGDRAEVILPQTQVSHLDESASAISLITTGGGTEIFQGLEKGFNQLRKLNESQLRQIILLTDGHTYGDEQYCIDLANQAGLEGIPISTLGIGDEWNDVFLDKLASLSGGSSSYIKSSQDLANFLRQKVAILSAIYAKGLVFEFENFPDVTLQYAFRLAPESGPLPLESPMYLGDLQFGKKIKILFEIKCNKTQSTNENIHLLKGRIKLEIPARSMPHARLMMDIIRPVTRTLRNDLPPDEIVEAMTKLNLYRMQEKARQEVAQGEIANATRHLQYLATNLLSQGDRELAKTVLVEAEQIQKSGHFSQDGEKRIKYGTRALLLLPPPEQT